VKNLTLLETVSAANDVNSGVYDLCDLHRFAVQVKFSGSNVVGTLKLQCSLDNVTWVDVANSSQAVTSSANHIWDVQSAGYRYVRVNWDYTSGTGNITVSIHVKDPVVSYG
jgi:hypothetical protein